MIIGTKERVLIRQGNRAIRVRVIEFLLYTVKMLSLSTMFRNRNAFLCLPVCFSGNVLVGQQSAGTERSKQYLVILSSKKTYVFELVSLTYYFFQSAVRIDHHFEREANRIFRVAYSEVCTFSDAHNYILLRVQVT